MNYNNMLYRYQEMDGYAEKNIVLNIFSPSKKEITADEFFENAVRKMVGSIRESEYVSLFIIIFLSA